MMRTPLASVFACCRVAVGVFNALSRKSARTAGLLVVLLSIAAVPVQAAFMGLTPGASTRDDAASVLGAPVRNIDAYTMEYTPPAGIARLEVQFGGGSERIERINVFFQRPVTRAALIKRYALPQQSDVTTNAPDGKIVEYFGGSVLLALTYASVDTSSGVGQVSYLSESSYAGLVGKTTPTMRLSTGMTLIQETALDGTNLTWYPRPRLEQCQQDCEQNAACAGFSWIQEGTYNPGDSAMCYLLSVVTRKNPARGHVSGVK